MRSTALPLLGWFALLLGLAFPAESQAQNKPKTPPTKNPPAKTPPTKNPPARTPDKGAGTQLAEAEVLQNAYLLLLEGDADYDGHRAKAMHAVKEAFKTLDAQVMQNGTAQQKQAIKQATTAIAAAEKARNNAGVMQEKQQASDRLLAGARKMLLELRPTLVQNKQNKIVGHVDTAVKEIGIALSIR
jgi:hypothetical protein